MNTVVEPSQEGVYRQTVCTSRGRVIEAPLCTSIHLVQVEIDCRRSWLDVLRESTSCPDGFELTEDSDIVKQGDPNPPWNEIPIEEILIARYAPLHEPQFASPHTEWYGQVFRWAHLTEGLFPTSPREIWAVAEQKTNLMEDLGLSGMYLFGTQSYEWQGWKNYYHTFWVGEYCTPGVNHADISRYGHADTNYCYAFRIPKGDLRYKLSPWQRLKLKWFW